MSKEIHFHHPKFALFKHSIQLFFFQPLEHLSKILHVVLHRVVINQNVVYVTTLALVHNQGKGVARLRAKKETRESHHMLPGVQKVWGNEPSHSQVNSHVGSWSPKWTPESSKRDYRGQNPLPRRVLYIIGKILKVLCLKWVCIAHSNIWNISYDQKKGQESNW
jgi:hypothetical protein